MDVNHSLCEANHERESVRFRKFIPVGLRGVARILGDAGLAVRIGRQQRMVIPHFAKLAATVANTFATPRMSTMSLLPLPGGFTPFLELGFLRHKLGIVALGLLPKLSVEDFRLGLELGIVALRLLYKLSVVDFRLSPELGIVSPSQHIDRDDERNGDGEKAKGREWEWDAGFHCLFHLNKGLTPNISDLDLEKLPDTLSVLKAQ